MCEGHSGGRWRLSGPAGRGWEALSFPDGSCPSALSAGLPAVRPPRALSEPAHCPLWGAELSQLAEVGSGLPVSERVPGVEMSLTAESVHLLLC